MKKFIGQILVAAVLAGLGYACWTVGEFGLRVAAGHEAVATLRDNAADDVEQSMPYLPSVPGLTDALVADGRGHRAAVDYWQRRYAAVVPQPNGATAEAVSQPPSVLALAANAAYRTVQGQGGNRQGRLRGLEEALKNYRELLTRDPGNADVAYNFEFLARLRDAVSRNRPGRPDAPQPTPAVAAPVMAGDLPGGRTVHGEPGAPPPNTDMGQFRMHIPLAPEERTEGEDKLVGGGARVRKG